MSGGGHFSGDRSLLRYGIERELARMAIPSGAVIDLGGRRDGRYARHFRARGCAYTAAGFEGDLRVDLGRERIPCGDASFDVAFVATVLMYLDDAGVDHLLAEARRVLRPGGRLIVCEPFLAHQVDHQGIPDRGRRTMQGMGGRVAAAGFAGYEAVPVGGLPGLGFTVLRDLTPGFLRPLRTLFTVAGVLADDLGNRLPYVRRRSARYYHGYVAQARKPDAKERG